MPFVHQNTIFFDNWSNEIIEHLRNFICLQFFAHSQNYRSILIVRFQILWKNTKLGKILNQFVASGSHDWKNWTVLISFHHFVVFIWDRNFLEVESRNLSHANFESAAINFLHSTSVVLLYISLEFNLRCRACNVSSKQIT